MFTLLLSDFIFLQVILNQKENCFILIQIDNKTKQGVSQIFDI